MAVIQKPVTAEDEELLKMPDDGLRSELVEGEARRKPLAGHVNGRIAINVMMPLDQYVRENSLGTLYATGTGFKLSSDPDTVRAPDVAFVRREWVEEVGDIEGYWPGAPGFLVEVVSPNDLYTEVEEKGRDWLEAGARMVVVVNPRGRSVRVHLSRTETFVLTEQDTLDGGNALPGWKLPVADIFR